MRAPGANDDASGVSVVLELLRVMVQRPPPAATIMLAAVAGEEQGLLGSTFLAQTLLEAGADPLAGQPNAEDSAKMFNKWDDQLKAAFEGARGRGVGARDAPPPVEDREEARRVPGGTAPTQQAQS